LSSSVSIVWGASIDWRIGRVTIRLDMVISNLSNLCSILSIREQDADDDDIMVLLNPLSILSNLWSNRTTVGRTTATRSDDDNDNVGGGAFSILSNLCLIRTRMARSAEEGEEEDGSGDVDDELGPASLVGWLSIGLDLDLALSLILGIGGVCLGSLRFRGLTASC
jgi:hypothetical protein